MMGYEASELESMQDEEAVQAPEPRAPEPRAPVPEPGLDLSLSPSPSPSPLPESPRRRPERAGQWGGARRGRQVRFRLAPLSPVRSERSEPLGDAASGPQTLEAPALQSSLALGLELQAARAAVAQFDASKAAEEQLSRSFQTRCVLEESVAEGLNVPRSRRLFRDLVSLQVPEEQVLKAALREKLALLPPPQARAPPPKEPPGPGPDMTILCDPDTLCYEAPHLTVEGLPPLRLQARTRPSEDTFLMHRTLRRWEA
ncbi:protein phosphatase 1 regulatory subunit 35 isoform X2 [Nannospalax galili]|uniref:Protein phosphatase 1, regulatory subunit 35 n=1 Tax=Nannospalax galili TaxID=1026970 RepID=A0A8C6RU14_NANGA|nr:protein phosphatase 1 regulatory subunit 35 isoform X2 [Nannospalax galili]